MRTISPTYELPHRSIQILTYEPCSIIDTTQVLRGSRDMTGRPGHAETGELNGGFSGVTLEPDEILGGSRLASNTSKT